MSLLALSEMVEGGCLPQFALDMCRTDQQQNINCIYSYLIYQQRIIPSAIARRPLSTEVAAQSSGGAGIFARVGSFLVGAGLTALVTEIYIFKEVREGNLEMLQKQRQMEKRIAALEAKK